MDRQTDNISPCYTRYVHHILLKHVQLKQKSTKTEENVDMFHVVEYIVYQGPPWHFGKNHIAKYDSSSKMTKGQICHTSYTMFHQMQQMVEHMLKDSWLNFCRNFVKFSKYDRMKVNSPKRLSSHVYQRRVLSIYRKVDLTGNYNYKRNRTEHDNHVLFYSFCNYNRFIPKRVQIHKRITHYPPWPSIWFY